MSQISKGKVSELLTENNLESGLVALCRKLGLSKELIGSFTNGYPENSAFLNESLDCVRTLIETFSDSDANTLALLQERTNYDHERLTRAAKYFHKCNQASTKG